MLDLEEFRKLEGLPGVVRHCFDQCGLGAATAKPTAVLSFGVDLPGFSGRCTHPPGLATRGGLILLGRPFARYWVPKLTGRLRHTAAASAYPSDMNRAFVWALIGRVRRSLPPKGGPPPPGLRARKAPPLGCAGISPRLFAGARHSLLEAASGAREC